jgi:hypothetical protein
LSVLKVPGVEAPSFAKCGPAEARLESRPRYKGLLLAARPMVGVTANAAIDRAAFCAGISGNPQSCRVARRGS